MLSADIDGIVVSLRESTPLGRLSLAAAHMVIDQLLSVGYDLVRPQPGDRLKLVESDEQLHSIVRWLMDTSPLGSLAYPECQHVFGWLGGVGWRIKLPDAHPSGIRCSEAPHTKVTRLGKGSSYHVDDRTRMPANGIASTRLGGECK